MKKSTWFCSTKCGNEAAKKPNSNEEELPDNPSNRDLLKEILEIKNSQDFIGEKYDQLAVKIDQFTEKLDAMEKRMSALEKENNALKSQLNKHQTNQQAIKSSKEQVELDKNVIISGVPIEFDVKDAVDKIVKTVIADFNDEAITKVERLFKTTDANKDKIDKIPIVVTMSSMDGVTKLLKSFKEKGILAAQQCGLPGEEAKFFIKQQLSTFNMNLMREARKLKQDGKLKHVWFQNSSVLVRADDASKIHKISTKDDLSKYK